MRPAPPLPSPQVLLAGLERRQAETQTISLEGRGSLKSGGRSLRGDFTITCARPGLLRLEAYGPFGLPALFVVVRGDEVQVVSFLERRYLCGKTSSPKLAAFLPLSLSSERLMALLAAAPLPPAPLRAESLAPGQAPDLQQAAKARGSALVVVEGQREPVRLLFGEDAELLAAALGGGDAELVALYGDWRPCSELSLPFRYEFSLPARERSLRLEVSRARLNEGLPASTFELEPPEGFKVIDVP